MSAQSSRCLPLPKAGVVSCDPCFHKSGARTPSTREPSPTESEAPTSNKRRLRRATCIELQALSLDSKLDSKMESRTHAEFVSDVARRISFIPTSPAVFCRSSLQEDPEAVPMLGSPSWALRRQRQDTNTGETARRSLTLNLACESARRLARPQSAPSGHVKRSKIPPEIKHSDSSASCAEQTVMKKGPADRALTDVFETFASGRKRMYWKDFERVCRECSLFDGQFMTVDARRIFNELLSKGHRSIGLQQFVASLNEVAFHRESSVEAVHRILVDGLNTQHYLG